MAIAPRHLLGWLGCHRATAGQIRRIQRLDQGPADLVCIRAEPSQIFRLLSSVDLKWQKSMCRLRIRQLPDRAHALVRDRLCDWAGSATGDS